MVRYSVAALLVLTLALSFASKVDSTSSVEHTTKEVNDVHATSKNLDPKFLGSLGGMGFPAPVTFGQGFAGALGYCQTGFLPFLDQTIGLMGSSLPLARVTMLLQVTVARFQMLVQYIQTLQCFTCGIPTPRIALFTQIATQMFIRIQTLLSLTHQFYLAQWASIQSIILPFNNLFPSFFGLCHGFGFQSTLAANSLWNPIAFRGFGLSAVSRSFTSITTAHGVGWKAVASGQAEA